MIFSKNAILQAIAAGALKIEPFTPDQVQAAHIDLHLELTDGHQELSIPAGGFALAKTKENITTSDDIAAFMEGKASLAKTGISIEQSSTFIEPGSDNQMTLELFNASDKDVVLQDGQVIAKMFVSKLIDRYK